MESFVRYAGVQIVQIHAEWMRQFRRMNERSAIDGSVCRQRIAVLANRDSRL
jgi:hypothetical protein